MNKIAECLQLYREKFPEDWISCMDWDTRPEAESQRGNVQLYSLQILVLKNLLFLYYQENIFLIFRL